jgi:Fe-S cluster assembly ATP-binding protein
MGPNGSGKSTVAAAILGSPLYKINRLSRIMLNGSDIKKLPTDERVKMGLFLAFQNPVTVPGVSVINLLRTSYREIYGMPPGKRAPGLQNPVLESRWQTSGINLGGFMKTVEGYSRHLHIGRPLLSRGINDGFSGGEKKKVEMLAALVIKPKYAIFDEIDTGLDVDALKIVADGMKKLRDQGTGIIVITHYQRLLKLIKPEVVHVLIDGEIAVSDDYRLVQKIEKEGYRKYLS